MKHLLVDPVGRRGWVNMSFDQALLDDADRLGTATLRLYRWDPPCLSLGRNESTRHYDRARIAQLGIDVVRRPTGGRAVWHEHEVTYAVAAPVDRFGSLRAAYCTIHQRLAAALRSLGADATLAPTRPTAKPPNRLSACFSHPVGGEVLIAGCKVVGSAQLRQGDAFLQHGSILLGGAQETIEAVIRQPSAIRHQTSDVRTATTLSAALGRSVTFEEVANAIMSTWGDGFSSTAPYRPLPSLTALFSDPSWTWRR
ncbi:MAG: hypothetical protein DMD28_09740 [Gemmatimonadetes bacterium]|nr:MAG: hypothetical protein DMD28_09740 [Gemmatimonadota bacterium]